MKITINDSEATITCDLEEAKQFLMKNPSAKASMNGTVAQLVYPINEVQVPTSLLKPIRHNR